MKFYMMENSIVGVNETNNRARETLFQVVRESAKRETVIAEVPTLVQAHKIAVTEKRNRLEYLRKNETAYDPVKVQYRVVQVNRFGIRTGDDVKMLDIHIQTKETHTTD